MHVFARIDHAAGAAEAGLTLAPTELIIFGNARGRHASDAVGANSRNRSAIEGIGLGRCIAHNVAFVQRTELGRAAAPHPERGTGRE